MAQATKEYRAPDFLADVKDLVGSESMQELSKGFDILEHTRKAVDWTSGIVDKAVGVLGGFVKGVSEAQQANFKKMAQLDPAKGMTEEQLDATIETVIDAATLSPLIAKNTAMKNVAKDFGERLSQLKDAKSIAQEKGLSWSKDYLSGATESLKKNFAVVARALRRMPQEALDLVDEVKLENIAGAKGVFRPWEGQIAYNIEGKIGPGTVGHELGHAEQLSGAHFSAKGVPTKGIPKAFMEAEMYEFGDLVENRLGKNATGSKIDKMEWEELRKTATENVTQRWGNEPYAYDMDEVLRHYVKSSPVVKSKGAKAMFATEGGDVEGSLKKFAEANDVNFQGRWEDFNGWLLTDRKSKSSALVRSEDDARKAIAKMRGVDEGELFELWRRE